MKTSERLRIVAAVCALVAGLSAGATAKIIYVDDDAKEGGTGSSWAAACRYLQPALTAAGTGDEIRVAQGCYRPDLGVPVRMMRPRTRSAAIEVAAVGSPLEVFQLKNGVALFGGFAGLGAVDPNARDPEEYQTVLSGDLRGNDVDSWGAESPVSEFVRSDNSLIVIQCGLTDTTTVLDGFVVESAVQSLFFNQGGSPHLANCIFRKGFSVALRCEGGQPILVNCVFQENGSTAASGGAISAINARLTLKDCQFLGNSALREGGAIYGASSDLSCTGCTFERNGAPTGGAIHQTAKTLTLVDCTFVANGAQEGGAVAFAVEHASMTHCIFKNNWAVMSGGAIENAGASLTLDQCTFTGNRASGGGALFLARISASKTAPGLVTTMTRCICAGNYASDMGGALYCSQTEVVIVNGTFTGNRAGRSATLVCSETGEPAAAYPIRLENCIVWDGGPSFASLSAPARVSRTGGSQGTAAPNVVVRYSDIQGGWEGQGNINVEPVFAASGYWLDADNPELPVVSDYSNAIWIEGDYHLKSKAGRWDPLHEDWVLDQVASPCIDAGDPNSPVANEPEPNGGRINLGAYGGTIEASKSYQASQPATEPPARRK